MATKNENIFELAKYRYKSCRHGKWIVDPSLNTVECGLCGEKMNPMYVLERIAQSESTEREQMRRLKEQAGRLKDRVRCKCEHCGKLTRIEKR